MQESYYHTSKENSLDWTTVSLFCAILLVFVLAGTLVHFRKLNLQVERELGEVNNQIKLARSENSDLRRRMTELASPVRVLGSVRCESLEEETIKPHELVISREELESSRSKTSRDIFTPKIDKKDESFVAALGNSAFFTGSAHAKE